MPAIGNRAFQSPPCQFRQSNALDGKTTVWKDLAEATSKSVDAIRSIPVSMLLDIETWSGGGWQLEGISLHESAAL
jgi:hypothetical protein